MDRTIRVFVIEDSAVDRTLITAIINKRADMTVIGAAGDPYEARERMRELDVDVVTLDVEMPRMNGLEFLEKLMRLRPTPVLMVSSLTEEAADVTFEALELGAVDFVTKPRTGLGPNGGAIGDELVAKIRATARARVVPRQAITETVRQPEARTGGALPADLLIAIGASTGGTEAIKEVLNVLPVDCPPIVIAQHMPPGFTGRFAKRLDSLCRISVSEARNGDRLQAGHAYLAPGGQHLVVERSGGTYRAAILEAAPGMIHKPSVDVLFRSVAKAAGAKAIGVILTGMGRDGASGLLEMREAGSFNVAQDEATCVVFGMPREAIAAGAAHEVLPLSQVARRVLAQVRSGARAAVDASRTIPA